MACRSSRDHPCDPEITIVARDRGGGYGEAIAKALPNAVQVADRWHLMENASHAFLGSVRKAMHDIRKAIGAAIINPALLTKAEKLQYDGYLRREETNAAVMALSNGHVSIMEIVGSGHESVFYAPFARTDNELTRPRLTPHFATA